MPRMPHSTHLVMFALAPELAPAHSAVAANAMAWPLIVYRENQ